MKKNAVSLIIAISLVLCMALVVGASDAPGTADGGNSEAAETASFETELFATESPIPLAIKRTRTIGQDDSWYGTQLAQAVVEDIPNSEDLVREIYSWLDSTIPGLANGARSITRTPTTAMTINSQADMDIYGDLMMSIMFAYLSDHPSVYSVDVGGGIGYTSSYSGGVFSLTYTLTIIDKNISQSKVQEIQSFVSGLSGSRVNKLRSIHDKVAAMLIYPASNLDNPTYHSMAALNGGYGVCEAYAETFKYMCDLAGIPAVVVDGVLSVGSGAGTGGAHMWNMVQLDDGGWYFVDVTNDDQSTLRDDLFLVTGSDIITLWENPGKRFDTYYQYTESGVNVNGGNPLTPPLNRPDEGGRADFGPIPYTGLFDAAGAAQAMYVFAAISIVLWGYIFIKRSRKHGKEQARRK